MNFNTDSAIKEEGAASVEKVSFVTKIREVKCIIFFFVRQGTTKLYILKQINKKNLHTETLELIPFDIRGS